MRVKMLALLAIAIVGLGIAGCPALMVGRLAYQDYKDKNESPSPTPSPGSNTGSQSNTM